MPPASPSQAFDLSAIFIQRRHPGNEAPLKRLGIERRKNIAEVIVGGRPVTKRSEPAQQIDLLLAEPRDIDEGLRSAQNREQTQQQHLGERINDFAAVARIGQILEMIQKNNALADRPQCFPSRLHRILR